MEWTPKQKWWLNFLMIALQGLTTLSWSQLNVNPHYIIAAAQIIAYSQILLNFMIYGATPPKSNGGNNAQIGNPGGASGDRRV